MIKATKGEPVSEQPNQPVLHSFQNIQAKKGNRVAGENSAVPNQKVGGTPPAHPSNRSAAKPRNAPLYI